MKKVNCRIPHICHHLLYFIIIQLILYIIYLFVLYKILHNNIELHVCTYIAYNIISVQGQRDIIIDSESVTIRNPESLG